MTAEMWFTTTRNSLLQAHLSVVVNLISAVVVIGLTIVLIRINRYWYRCHSCVSSKLGQGFSTIKLHVTATIVNGSDVLNLRQFRNKSTTGMPPY